MHILLSSFVQASGGFHQQVEAEAVFFLNFVLSWSPTHMRAASPAGSQGSALTLGLPSASSQFDRLWKEMPVTAKGRLRYLDFLSRFSSEKTASPPSSGNSAKAHRRGDVPATSEGGRAVGSPPARDSPKAGTKPRSQQCVSSHPWGPRRLAQAHRPPGGSPVFPQVWVPGEGHRGAWGGVIGQEPAWERQGEGRGE